jgi:hypothetical protein
MAELKLRSDILISLHAVHTLISLNPAQLAQEILCEVTEIQKCLTMFSFMRNCISKMIIQGRAGQGRAGRLTGYATLLD